MSLETVLSVPSPDCDSLRLRESDNCDLFGGGKRILSGLSKFSLDGRPDSHSSIDKTVSTGSESNRALLVDLGLDGRKSSDLVFRFLAKGLT